MGKAILFRSLEDVLAGIAAYHARLVAHLRAYPLSPERERLLAALQQVPWGPARNFYEGLVAVNFAYFLDGCDSLGRFDQVLGALYEADLDAGRLTEAEGVQLVRCLWRTVDADSGWNVAIGGTVAEEGSTAGLRPAYNRLTVACLRAAVGLRRPNLALRVRRDMPQEVWNAALDCLASGCGLPALYHEEAYLDALRAAGLIAGERDLYEYAFGGCTETMVHGCSNVGSLDAGINLPLILTGALQRVLPQAPTFEAVLEAYQEDVATRVARVADGISRQQQIKAAYHPQLVRTLLIEDCLERGLEYNAGWRTLQLERGQRLRAQQRGGLAGRSA